MKNTFSDKILKLVKYHVEKHFSKTLRERVLYSIEELTTKVYLMIRINNSDNAFLLSYARDTQAHH